MNISSLVDWCKQLKDATLPEQDKERKAVADIGEAMFPISIAKDDSVKDYSFLDAIKPLRNFRLDKDIFADYYNN